MSGSSGAPYPPLTGFLFSLPPGTAGSCSLSFSFCIPCSEQPPQRQECIVSGCIGAIVRPSQTSAHATREPRGALGGDGDDDGEPPRGDGDGEAEVLARAPPGGTSSRGPPPPPAFFSFFFPPPPVSADVAPHLVPARFHLSPEPGALRGCCTCTAHC